MVLCRHPVLPFPVSFPPSLPRLTSSSCRCNSLRARSNRACHMWRTWQAIPLRCSTGSARAPQWLPFLRSNAGWVMTKWWRNGQIDKGFLVFPVDGNYEELQGNDCPTAHWEFKFQSETRLYIHHGPYPCRLMAAYWTWSVTFALPILQAAILVKRGMPLMVQHDPKIWGSKLELFGSWGVFFGSLHGWCSSLNLHELRERRNLAFHNTSKILEAMVKLEKICKGQSGQRPSKCTQPVLNTKACMATIQGCHSDPLAQRVVAKNTHLG